MILNRIAVYLLGSAILTGCNFFSDLSISTKSDSNWKKTNRDSDLNPNQHANVFDVAEFGDKENLNFEDNGTSDKIKAQDVHFKVSSTPQISDPAPKQVEHPNELTLVNSVNSIEEAPDFQNPLRVNVGGFSFTDEEGIFWETDQFFSNTRTGFFLDFKDVKETTKARMYQSERFSKNLNYSVPVPNGRYEVILHFAEIWAEEKQKRVFSGMVEKEIAFLELDLFAEVGGHHPYVVKKIVDVIDGTLDIDLWAIKNNAKLSGYEIHQIKTFEAEAAFGRLEGDIQKPIRINVGGGAVLTKNGVLFNGDQHFNNEKETEAKIYRRNIEILGSDDPVLYQTERFAKELNYEFAVQNGDYKVSLHMAEIWTEDEGVRIFDVFLEGNKALENLDLIKDLGEIGKSEVYELETTVTDGALNISLKALENNAKLSAIEIVPIFDLPKKILLFSKTNGFRHKSIEDGTIAIEKKAMEKGVELIASEDANIFQDQELVQFDAIILLSTTGDYLNDLQQEAFKRFVRSGRGVVGIHAATDAEYDWQWYRELLGASFNRHPKPQDAVLNIRRKDHRSTKHLPEVWEKFDEWYNFAPNPRENQVDVLITIDESSYDPGINAMGDDHPIAWCKHFQNGRSFYTASGHFPARFREAEFIDHIWGGVEFAMFGTPLECNPNL